MWLGTIAFLTGILLCQQLTRLPPAYWYLSVIPLALLAYRVSAIRIPALIVVGFFWAMWRADIILSTGLPIGLEGENVTVTGWVASIPETNDRGVRFDFEISQLDYKGETRPAPGRVRISWYDKVPEIDVGDEWQLTVRLKRPHGLMNPGGFDFERWLFQNRIRATGYVRQDGANRLIQSRLDHYPVQRVRAAIKGEMARLLGERTFIGILTALAIGDSDGISRSQWEVFNRTSTSHLVAISGLHIGLVAALLFFLLRKLWGYTGRFALYVPAPRAAAIVAAAGALAYSALAGFSIPTQRSLIMISVVMAGVFWQKQQGSSRVLALALLAVLLFDPLAVLSAGFWLSFAAVAAMLFAMGGRLSAHGAWWKWGRVHLVVAVALAPVLLVLFQQVAWLSPVANFIAVPVVSLVIVPLTLLGVLFLPLPAIGGALLLLAEWLFSWVWKYLDWLSAPELAIWSYQSPPLWTLVPALVGVVWLLAPRGWPSRWVGVIWMMPLVMLPSARPAEGEAWFTLLDVGQGLAAVVRTRDHTLVFDTGARFSDEFDAGAAAVVPFLKSQGVTDIDVLVVSHGDNDHIGGSAAVIDSFSVGQILTSVPEKFSVARVRSCTDDLTWSWNRVQFTMLQPDGVHFDKGNNRSCVLHVMTASGAILLPGDIEKSAERWLVNHRGAQLKADILVAPHHGSNTSSTQEFIDAVQPGYVLFPVGYRNRYGFPRPKVVERYRAAGATLLESSHHGAITFRLAAAEGAVLAKTYRQFARRYWHTLDDEQVLVPGTNQYHDSNAEKP
ncbi:MAG: competence protein ComEC [Gammaproteobacteria bacterium]|nr:MAG: competence protein ComEC [Gammaproteobacteria bacterium]TND06840.1 MAG: competence protein ComEC [Gammaproteobacteria bacterium]